MCDDRRYHILRSGCEVPYIPSELSEPMSRLILAALADHTNTKGVVYVSTRTLAAELDISPNTVLISYRLFEAEGIMQRTGRKVGKGGTIEYQMFVEHLTPRNRRFVPLPTLNESRPRTAPKAISDRKDTDPQTTDESDEFNQDGTANTTVTPSDAAIRERSGSRSRSRSRSENLNSNQNQNNGSRAADIEVLFDDALDLELEYRPSEVSRKALREKKKHIYSQAAEKVLDTYPTARPSIQADRDLALAVCEMMNPGDSRFRVGTTTRQALNNKYQDGLTVLMSGRLSSSTDLELGF